MKPTTILAFSAAAWLLMAATLPPMPQATFSVPITAASTNAPLPTNVVITFAPDKLALIQQSNDLSNWYDFTNGISPIILPISTNQDFFRGWYKGDLLTLHWGAMPTNFTMAQKVGIWVPTGWKCVWASSDLTATNCSFYVTNSFDNGLQIFVAGVTMGTNWWPYTKASANYFTLAGKPAIALHLSITNQ